MVTEQPMTGTQDDDDDRDDEHSSENEALVRETDEHTQAPEELEFDDEDQRGPRRHRRVDEFRYRSSNI